MHNKYESSMCYLERSVSFSPFSMFLFTEALPAGDGLVALALLLGVAAALEAAALEEASREGERRRRGEGAERGRVLVPGKVGKGGQNIRHVFIVVEKKKVRLRPVG